MYRKERITERLLAFLAQEVRQMRDPRFQSVSITEVDLSADCRYARVYWSCFNVSHPEDGVQCFLTQRQIIEVNDALRKASKFLKRKIGTRLELRYVPELVFEYDQSIQTGARIDSLLSKLGS